MTPDASALEQTLSAYKAWLKQNAPTLAAQLCKGLKVQQVRVALGEWERRQKWRFPLPSEVYPLFTVFNGGSHKAALLPSADDGLPGLALGSLDYMNQWRNNSAGMIYLCKSLAWYRSLALDDAMRRDFWNDFWFPFAMGEIVTEQESVQVTALLDFAPSANGNAGQVALHIERTEQFRVHLERRVIATSLRDYFDTLLDDLEGGRVVFDQREGLRRSQSEGKV